MNRREILRLILVAPVAAIIIPKPDQDSWNNLCGPDLSIESLADAVRQMQEDEIAQIENNRFFPPRIPFTIPVSKEDWRRDLSGPVVDLNHIGEVGFW